MTDVLDDYDDDETDSQSSHLVKMGRTGASISKDVGGRKLRAGHTWYRGEHINFLPNKALLQQGDAIERFVLKGLTPKEPFIDSSSRITAFGSCFAENISTYLNARHFNVLTKQDTKAYVVKFGEGMVHSYAIRQQFEWALEGAKVNADLWHDKSAEAQGADEEIRENTRRLFMETDVFILTFGLSEVWYSKETGEVFWRGIPETEFDSQKHGFRVVSTEENRANIQAIYDLIRKHRPEARAIFTLSPVPLVATFRPVECLVANSYSKATLRAALDDVLRANSQDDKFFYWPSYEIITEFFHNPWMNDRRHPNLPIIRHIMRLFEEYYCIPGQRRASLIQTLTSALMSTGQIEPRTRFALKKGDKAGVLAAAAKQRAAGNTEFAAVLEQAAEHYKPAHHTVAEARRRALSKSAA